MPVKVQGVSLASGDWPGGGWLTAMHAVQVAAMVQRATAFARRYLSARGRDCYFVQLLRSYHALQRDPVQLSSNVEYTPDWSCC